MGIKFANSAFATLASGINSSATSITLTTGQGARFPSLSAGDYFYATLIDTSNNLEIVKCTARSTDVLTVTRGQESTTARAFSTGDRIELRVTAQGLVDASGDLASGTLAIPGTSASGAIARLYEDTDNGTNYIGLKAPASVASNLDFTLPSTDGTNGQFLKTNGSGVLSFDTVTQKVLTWNNVRKSDTFGTNNTSFTNVTGLSLTVTPQSSSSVFYVSTSMVLGIYSWSTNGLFWRGVATWSGGSNNEILGINGTSLTSGNGDIFSFQYGADSANSAYETIVVSDSQIVSLGTANAITFGIQIATPNASYAAYVNRSDNGTFVSHSRSSLTVVELTP